jgi:hypothetical protein
MSIELTTKVIEVVGVDLPWIRRKGYAPDRNRIVESGTVFVPLELLKTLAERGKDDYLFEPTPYVTQHEGLALEQAKLATREPGDGFFGTAKLRQLLKDHS